MQNSTWIALIAVALLALVMLVSPRAPHSSGVAQSVRTPELPRFVLEMPSGSLASVALSEDGRRLAVARNFVSEQEGRAITMTELKLFDLDSGQALWAASYANPNCCGLPIVKITPDAQFVLGAGKQLHLYAQAGQELKIFSFQEDPEFTLLSADLSADGRYIAATSSHRTYLFSSEGEQLWSVEFPEVPTAALSGDGRYLLVATKKLFRLLRTSDLQMIREGLLPFEGPVVSLAISDDGSAFAIAGNPRFGEDQLTVRVYRQGDTELQQIALSKVSVPRIFVDKGWAWVEGAFGGEAALIPLGEGSPRRFAAEPEPTHGAMDALRDRLALARGGVVELHRLTDDTLLWQAQVQGKILALVLKGERLIALGKEQGDAVLPDRVWVFLPITHTQR